MSGGSFNYGCYTLKDLYEGKMLDAELNRMIVDLCEVLHDLEWYVDCDISEEKYRETVRRFKKKWFGKTEVRVKDIVNERVDELKNELMTTFEYLIEEV